MFLFTAYPENELSLPPIFCKWLDIVANPASRILALSSHFRRCPYVTPVTFMSIYANINQFWALMELWIKKMALMTTWWVIANFRFQIIFETYQGRLKVWLYPFLRTESIVTMASMTCHPVQMPLFQPLPLEKPLLFWPISLQSPISLTPAFIYQFGNFRKLLVIFKAVSIRPNFGNNLLFAHHCSTVGSGWTWRRPD